MRSLLLFALTLLSANIAVAQDAKPTAATSPDDAARRAQVVVRADGFQITVGDVEDAIGGQSPYVRARYADPKEREALVGQMVRFELLSREAERRGHGKNAGVARSHKQTSVQTMLRKLIDEAVTPASITAEEVKAYYEAHPSEFHRDGMMRASHILVATKERAQEIAAKAKKGDAKAFREMAQAESLDTETKLRGGDLHYFDKAGIPMRMMPRYANKLDEVPASAKIDEAIAKAAFELKQVGDVSRPVAVGEHWSVLRLTGTRAAEHRTLAEADEVIRQRLWRDKRKETLDTLVKRLEAEVKPEVHTDHMNPIRFEAPKPSGETAARGAAAMHGHGGHGHGGEGHPGEGPAGEPGAGGPETAEPAGAH